MTNLDSILKSRVITLLTKVCIVKAVFFSNVCFFMYGCESWTVKKAECRRIDAFELWCWRRLLRAPWTARRSNQSILKEISPGYSLEGLLLKLKLQYLATWCEELTPWRRPRCWERLKARGEADNGHFSSGPDRWAGGPPGARAGEKGPGSWSEGMRQGPRSSDTPYSQINPCSSENVFAVFLTLSHHCMLGLQGKNNLSVCFSVDQEEPQRGVM